VLCAGGGAEDRGEVIAPEADDIAGEGSEIAQQGVEAVHREWSALATGEIRVAALDLLALKAPGSRDGSRARSKRFHGNTIAHTPSRVENLASYSSDSRQGAGEPPCP
jgi:hypothetical protein